MGILGSVFLILR